MLAHLEHIVKDFGAIRALDDVSFDIHARRGARPDGRQRRGQVDTGQDDRGQLPAFRRHHTLSRASRCSFAGPADARRHGIEVVYQDLALCNNLTAAANVFLGRELRRGWGPFTMLDHRSMNVRANELFSELKSETRPADLVVRMSGGQRQAVAIARTRLARSKIVLMDEPTAAISVRQVAEVLALIRRMKDQGLAVILISHRMPDVFEVCDRIVVMRRGRKVADRPIAETSPEEVTGLITGAIASA